MVYMSVELLFPCVCQAGIMKMVGLFLLAGGGRAGRTQQLERGWLQSIQVVLLGAWPQVSMVSLEK